MKAVILAGGFGTRLRPLSCTRPKLLFPIANRPLLDWTLESLSNSGVDEVVLAVSYMAYELERYFGPSKYDVKIFYSFERRPLGTAGAVKKAKELVGDDETFLVLNGDVLCKINYRDILKIHKKHGASVTMALCEVPDPSRFGVVEIGDGDQIRKFVEKPKLEEAPSKLINMGIYTIEPEILKLIPTDAKISIEREIFPDLAREGKMYGYRYEGSWGDVGKPEDYVLTNNEFLDQIAKSEAIIGKGVHIHEKAKIVPPSIIGDNVEIEEEAIVGPYVSIGEGSVIKKGCRIERSIIFPKAWIDNFSSIHSAIIGAGAVIGQWVKIEKNVIVGDNAVIYDNVTLTQEVKVCPSKDVEESILGPKQVM
ncbi:MAG TPA: NDP-sugar synthase [archaeon]|nr:NDP-sugar synthase [archaeon]